MPRCRECLAEALTVERWNRRTPGPAMTAMLDKIARHIEGFEEEDDTLHLVDGWQGETDFSLSELRAFLAEWGRPAGKDVS
jgi:hypothetical protein